MRLQIASVVLVLFLDAAFVARAGQTPDRIDSVFGDHPSVSPDKKFMAYFALREHRGDNPNATALVIQNLPRQRNLWLTDTVEWCREGRLA
jgi:hypothetical protein